jgi:hypothetical protein
LIVRLTPERSDRADCARSSTIGMLGGGGVMVVPTCGISIRG